MTSKSKKPEGPTCACGRVDLLEEMKKMEKESEKKEPESKSSDVSDS